MPDGHQDSADLPALAAEGVTFIYHRRQASPTLDGVTLPLTFGTLTVLLGPNASGKSTLIKCLAGVHRPTGGRVLLGREDVSRLSARAVAERVAYAPQSVPVPFAFTVAELLLLNLSRGRSSTHATDAALLDEFDLGGMAGRSLLSLSGGERQRAISARAFAQKAPILLLDEPTAHLDLRHQVGLMEAAKRRARQGAAVCIVLHDLNLASQYADTIVLLSGGKVAATGSVAEVLRPPVLTGVYGASVDVLPGPEGRPIVLPAYTAASDTQAIQDLTVS